MRARRAALALLLFATRAAAAPSPAAMDVDRDDAPPARGELGFDGGAPLGDWAVDATLGALSRPITLRASDGTLHVPVASRQGLGLGGGVALGESALLDLRVGFAHQTGDRFIGLGDDRALAAWVPLDARLGARVRVVSGARLALFVRGELTAPLGDAHEFAGEAGWTGAWSLIARVALPGGVVAAAAGGIRLRGQEVTLGDVRLGDETTAAVGVSVPVPPLCHLWCQGQVSASGEVVAILGDAGSSVAGPSPVEARVGLVSRPRPWLEIAGRVGAGLDDAVGAPRWRATLSVTWRRPTATRVAPPEPRREPLGDPDDDATDDE